MIRWGRELHSSLNCRSKTHKPRDGSIVQDVLTNLCARLKLSPPACTAATRTGATGSAVRSHRRHARSQEVTSWWSTGGAKPRSTALSWEESQADGERMVPFPRDAGSRHWYRSWTLQEAETGNPKQKSGLGPRGPVTTSRIRPKPGNEHQTATHNQMCII